MKVLLFQIIISAAVLAQNINFNSPENIRLFADFLFCDRDYLRAIDEYEKYLSYSDEDTIRFKIALAFSAIGDQYNAIKNFNSLQETSKLYQISRIEELKSLFNLKQFSQLNSKANELNQLKSDYSDIAKKIVNLSYLLNNESMPSEKIFLEPFDVQEKTIVQNFYFQKTNPDYKSEVLAGVYSAIIPGLGKIYTENYSDGITSFLLTGLFSYLAYTNFNNDHPVRAWIFTLAGAGFYAGNVYGSIASAQIFNAKINFDFINDVYSFIEEKKYFIPEYDFCK
ncbi:MAG: hypothetical protein HND40_02325 [Ignavibacteriota bacterium]|nr:hypothetical protein [Ignavibacteriota bacterium]MBW7841650.1 hypothetical protein [Ignavibacterium sp.]MCO6448635.1 hypothetical protein [Ignavibacterium album]MCZ2268921.1 hypothetical protein [Ignavibacteriales bacterium]HOJ07919.1 hypothetical protein [Ignavibacteriaceae bacterium]